MYTKYGWEIGWANPEGGSTGWEFNIEISKFKSEIGKLDPFYRGFCYSGLAYSYNYKYSGDAGKILKILKKIPEQYRSFFQGSALWNGESYYRNPKSWFRTLKDYPEKYKSPGYRGLGRWIYYRYEDNPDKWTPFLAEVNKEYRAEVYEGIGWGMGDYYLNNPQKYNLFIERLDIENRDEIYKGIGYRLAFYDYPNLNFRLHTKYIPARYQEYFRKGYKKAVDYRKSL